MVSLIQVRDAIALAGRVELNTLSRQLQTSPSLLEALIERLVVLGKVEKVEQSHSTVDRCNRSCLGCCALSSCQKQCYYRCTRQ